MCRECWCIVSNDREETEKQMSEQHATHKGTLKQPATMVIEVQVRQSCRDCPVLNWDREHERLHVADISRAKPGLPADLASLQLEGQLDVPVLLLNTTSFPPGTYAQARLLGAFALTSPELQDHSYPTHGWLLVAAAEVDSVCSEYQSLEALPQGQLDALKGYVQSQTQQIPHPGSDAVQACHADTAARFIRETRLLLKREQRTQPKGKGRPGRTEEERPVAWRAVAGLAESLRLRLQEDAALQRDKSAPHAQAEQLIRFVPQRFQEALADLLLDDERLLAFVERPLLRHRAGLLGIQMWRSNEGLLVVTDRQVLWLRDFLAPGSGFLPGGYIAHAAPLERLQEIAVLPAGSAPESFAGRLESKDSPYQRLVMEVASCAGSELFVVEFPQRAEMGKALARITGMLREFLPYPNGTDDHRVRRLPIVEAWQPRGAEAQRLAGLGGIVPQHIARRLEERLSQVVSEPREALVSALIPALEDFKSPARLLALTRAALLVCEEPHGTSRRTRSQSGQRVEVRRFDLASISSAQLRYSLLGSSLSIFVPHPDGRTQQQVFPFHSPAIAWFLPLFTRLRLLLSGPYRRG
jgi:hypothetical protein